MNLLNIATFACLAAAIPCAFAQDSHLPLRVGPMGMLARGPESVRAIGVNCYDAYIRTLVDGGDRSYERGFAELERFGIPFARFAVMAYWPSGNRLFLDNREEALRRLDGVVESAERHGIGLVPSIFWATFTVPDLMGEPRSAWGDPNSATRAFMLELTEAIVTRYRDSPAIWAWEFGNEYILDADLPNAPSHRPPINVELATPATRGPEDDLATGMVRDAYTAFGNAVRQIDGKRPISSGDAYPRAHAAGMIKSRGRDWGPIDTREELSQVLTLSAPDPLDLISVHIYPQHTEEDRFKKGHFPDYRELLENALDAADRAGKALFVGEFGASVGISPSVDTEDRSFEEFTDLLATLVHSKTPLAALWNFDGAPSTGIDDQPWNIAIGGERTRYLDAIAKANSSLPRH